MALAVSTFQKVKKISSRKLEPAAKYIEFLSDNEPSEADREYLQRYKKAILNLDNYNSKNYNSVSINSIGQNAENFKKSNKSNLERVKKSIFQLENYENSVNPATNRFIVDSDLYGKFYPIGDQHHHNQYQQQTQQLISHQYYTTGQQQQQQRTRKSVGYLPPSSPSLPLPAPSSPLLVPVIKPPAPDFQQKIEYPWCNEFEDCNKKSKIGFIPQYPEPCPIIKQVGPPPCPYQQQQFYHPGTYSYPQHYSVPPPPPQPSSKSCGC